MGGAIERWVSEQSREYAEGPGFGQAERALMRGSSRSASFIHMLLEGVPSDRRGEHLILDVGCSDGAMTDALAKEGFDVVGLDLPAVIERTKRVHPDRKFVAGVVDQLSAAQLLALIGKRPTGIYAAEVIEHLVDDAHALRTFLEVLRPGGFVWIDTPGGPEKVFEADHLRYYPLPSLVKLVVVSGFVLDFIGTAESQNVVVGRKP